MSEPSSEQSIFLHAIGLPSPERAAYLDDACRDNPALRAELDALLAAHDRLGGGGSPTTGPEPADGTPAGAKMCEAVGAVLSDRYKLLEQIGEGGMGTVWMAQQTEPVKRLVALKVIKPGMDSKQVLARFEAERQALALMEYPNIARVFDAGKTATGRPYFVMELVKGVPLTKYCDEHRLTPKERLELFIPVCQAIHHAHQKGIIHRDIKPSNVLVALYDGKPVPKVIDFGVAKAAGQQLTEHTLVTGFGAVIGTLEYMSPEQAELNQLDIDTRSDIYSLGVLLYELLTGSTPLEHKRVQETGFVEALRIIREEEPPTLSNRLSTTDELASIAANRGTEPAKLTRLVRGELDWIVMKALEKDRNRRYETASAFAADLQRYLQDEPVQAGPPSAIYRFRKFVRRNRRAVMVAILIFVLLVGGSIGTTLGWLRAVEAESHATGQQKLAEEREQQADAARGRMREAMNMITGAVMEQFLGRQVELGEQEKAFLRRVERFYEEFAHSQGESAQARRDRAGGYQRVAGIRHRLGELAEAETALRAALAIRQQLAADFPTAPAHQMELAQSHASLGMVLYAAGRLREAEQAYGDAQRIFQQLAADSPGVSEYRYDLALVHNSTGNLFETMKRSHEAKAAYDQAQTVLRNLASGFPTMPRYRQHLALVQNNLGSLFLGLGQPKEAAAAYSESVALRKVDHGLSKGVRLCQ
jgi:serine/threonine protein kinase/tetratricopeptide (TPR) repeat protein